MLVYSFNFSFTSNSTHSWLQFCEFLVLNSMHGNLEIRSVLVGEVVSRFSLTITCHFLLDGLGVYWFKGYWHQPVACARRQNRVRSARLCDGSTSYPIHMSFMTATYLAYCIFLIAKFSLLAIFLFREYKMVSGAHDRNVNVDTSP